MELNDLLELTRAGWSKAEIMQLFGSAKNEKQDIEDITEDTPEDTPKESVEAPKEPVEAPKPSLTDQKVDELIAKLDKLSSGIQKGNLRGSRQPVQESVEDALASIINPYLNKEE